MAIKRLFVCGDSFSAVSKVLPGTSYSELLADKLGWELHNYARRGCSNGGIRIQIDEAIRQQADFVIVIPTSWDRFEIPATSAPYTKTREDTGWSHPLQEHLLDVNIGNGYDPKLGIQNINYGGQPSTMIFETIFSLAENYEHEYRGKLDKDTHRAVQAYVNHLYDSNWKRQVDQWIIADGLTKLHDAGIPFSVEPGMLWELWPRDSFNALLPKVIDDRCIRKTNEETASHATYLFPLADTSKDPGYHGALASQEYLADMFYDIIKNQWEL